jgi:hypothetical protein
MRAMVFTDVNEPLEERAVPQTSSRNGQGAGASPTPPPSSITNGGASANNPATPAADDATTGSDRIR